MEIDGRDYLATCFAFVSVLFANAPVIVSAWRQRGVIKIVIQFNRSTLKQMHAYTCIRYVNEHALDLHVNCAPASVCMADR